MDSRGMLDAPFQLMINVIVFGMVIGIGFYLYDNASCWRCNELLKAEVTNVRELIASIGKGDTNSRDSMFVKIEDLGSCAKGIYLRHINSSDGTGLKCASFCPQHPNSCWVMIPESTCAGGELDYGCVDISGEMNIEADPTVLGTVATSDNPWLVSAYRMNHNIMISVEKVGPEHIYIGKG